MFMFHKMDVAIVDIFTDFETEMVVIGLDTFDEEVSHAGEDDFIIAG